MNDRAELQKEMRIKRLTNQITHDEYYLWLASHVGFSMRMLMVSSEEVNNSKDQDNLNDIPLKRWDDHYVIASRCNAASLSLSDCVCMAKCLAKERRRLEKLATESIQQANDTH